MQNLSFDKDFNINALEMYGFDGSKPVRLKTDSNGVIQTNGITSEIDPLSIHLNQTSPQTLSGGAFAGSGLLKVTSGLLGVDTNTYALNSSLSSYLPLAGGTMLGTLTMGTHTLQFGS